MSDPQRIYFLGFEIQHIFVTQLSVSERNSEGAKLLRSIGFDLDARSNQLAVFKNAATLAALRNAPADIQVAFAAAGFGWNQQNSTGNADSQVNAHPEYNRFNVETLNDLALDAVEFDWTPETKRRAVYDLHRFMTNFNASGSLSIQGTTQQQFDQAWAAWQAQNGTENYKTLSTEAAAAIDSYATAFDATPVGAGEDNSVMRAEIAANLLTQLEGVLTPKELANAQRYFDNGSFTGGVASLIHDAQLRSSTPVLGNGIAAENLAIKLWSSEDGFLGLDVLIDKLKGVFDFMTGFADSMADNISALGDDLIATIGKSVNAMLVGLGGSAIGDIVEFLNAAYEPIKKGFRTGDWSDFGETVAQYGVAAAISAVLVIGSVAIATAVAGPIAAAFVAAGWAAYGLYDAITNGVELLGKISADLADVIPKIGETIEDIGKAIEKYVAVISRIVANAMDVDFNAPIFAGTDGPLSLVNKYIVDSLDPDLPGRIKGSDQNERFYGRNNAFIDAGGGNDEAYVRHTTTALGGAGDDILAGADARVIRAGAPLNLDAPNGAVAANDLRMLLDGGAGNDWVFALGGTGAIVVGGEGRDFLYNSSRGGQLWGDGLDGRGASGTGAANSDTFWWSAGSFIMDAGKNDRLQLFGIPLIGGSNAMYYGIGLERAVARDYLLPWVTYGLTESGQLLVEASVGQNLSTSQSNAAILDIAQVVESWDKGDLGIEFLVRGGGDEISLLRAVFRVLGAQASAVSRFAKNLAWLPSDDPLVLDLNGDGLVSKGIGAVRFDQDGDYFAERSGWISGDDGFLVHDADGSGTVDDISEMFGSPGVSGFAELAGWDTNGDGIVNGEDANFAQLKVWRDRDGDAVTDAGELYSLADLNITALSARGGPNRPVTTANGTVIRAESFFARNDGTTGAIGELIFQTDRVNTVYRGERGIAGYAAGYDALPSVAGEQRRQVNAKGYGRIADLGVAASNDMRVMFRCSYLVHCDVFDFIANDNEQIRERAA